nr:hypothetical protein [Tanacetum cinerariifolium]
ILLRRHRGFDGRQRFAVERAHHVGSRLTGAHRVELKGRHVEAAALRIALVSQRKVGGSGGRFAGRFLGRFAPDSQRVDVRHINVVAVVVKLKILALKP